VDYHSSVPAPSCASSERWGLREIHPKLTAFAVPDWYNFEAFKNNNTKFRPRHKFETPLYRETQSISSTRSLLKYKLMLSKLPNVDMWISKKKWSIHEKCSYTTWEHPTKVNNVIVEKIMASLISKYQSTPGMELLKQYRFRIYWTNWNTMVPGQETKSSTVSKSWKWKHWNYVCRWVLLSLWLCYLCTK